LIRRLSAAGTVRLIEITSEIRVTSFWATVLVESESGLNSYGAGIAEASGWAAHPDPEVAANMALLEASQTLLMPVMGGREDLTVYARSLGRHERTRALTRAGILWPRQVAPETKPFKAVEGLRTRDALHDLRWTCERLRRAAFKHVLVSDFSLPEISPARVVRAVIPGIETINPFRTGPRARLRMLEDLVNSDSPLLASDEMR